MAATTRNKLGNWYVAKTITRKEEVAKANLRNQGIRTFLPKLRKTSRQAGIFKNGLCPLFPSYIFFAADANPAVWRAVSGTLGISKIVLGDGRSPGVVPTAFMSELLSSCDGDIFSVDNDPLQIGSSVQIEQGPFSGAFGKVSALNDKDRISLFLEIMGGTTVSMPTAYVSIIE